MWSSGDGKEQEAIDEMDAGLFIFFFFFFFWAVGRHKSKTKNFYPLDDQQQQQQHAVGQKRVNKNGARRPKSSGPSECDSQARQGNSGSSYAGSRGCAHARASAWRQAPNRQRKLPEWRHKETATNHQAQPTPPAPQWCCCADGALTSTT